MQTSDVVGTPHSDFSGLSPEEVRIDALTAEQRLEEMQRNGGVIIHAQRAGDIINSVDEEKVSDAAQADGSIPPLSQPETMQPQTVPDPTSPRSTGPRPPQPPG